MATSVAPDIGATSPDANGDINSLIAGITQTAVADALAIPAEDKPRGADGRFVKADGSPSDTPVPNVQAAPVVADPAAPAPVADPAALEAEPAPLELPEGIVAPKPVTGRDLATQFTLKDADGELEIPDVMVTFTANGKERTEPLDKVVKFAQMGVYNAQRQQETEAVQRRAEDVQLHNAQLLAALQQAHSRVERLLSSDDAYLTERAQYEQQNTPQARAERATAERDFIVASSAGQQFFTQHVEPGIQQITQSLPEVTPEEIANRILSLNQRFLVNTPFGSVIHPQAHGAVAQSIVTDVIPWAARLNADRAASKESDPPPSGSGTAPKKITAPAQSTAAPDESAKVRQLQAEAQRARNLNTRGQRPARTPGSAPTRDTPKPKPITSLQDAEQSALDETFAALGMTRQRGS